MTLLPSCVLIDQGESAMATLSQKQELVEDIKRPIRYYRIRLIGYGGELVYGRSCKDEYDFWQTEEAKQFVGYNPEEDVSEPVQIYMWEKDEDPQRFENIPEEFKREGEWYEQDDIDHITGISPEACYVEITEVDSYNYNANELETVLDKLHWYDEFVDDYQADIIVEESPAFDESFVFCGYSLEKGQFYDGVFETAGRIDLSKLKFYMSEFPNGEELIYMVEYNGEEIENDGGDTSGKALYIELQDLS